MPERFSFPGADTHAWEPQTLFPDWDQRKLQRGTGAWLVIGRLKAGVDLAEARSDMQRVASELAAETYGLEILKRNMEDADHNTTRFVVLSKERTLPAAEGKVITSLLFSTKSVPAALYKAIGGFATNSVNITKLESYTSGKYFEIAQFYMDIEGHPSEPAVARALEELSSFSKEVKVLGVYPADPFRYGK